MITFADGFFIGVISALTLFYIGLVFHKCDVLGANPNATITNIRRKAFGVKPKLKPLIHDDEAAFRKEKEDGDKNGA